MVLSASFRTNGDPDAVGANGIDLSVLHASSYQFCYLEAPTVLRMIAWGN